MELKASDLRIGNLLFKPYSDEAVIVDIAILTVINNKAANIDNYRPIPLTEEWLLNFGFESDTYANFNITIDSEIFLTASFYDYECTKFKFLTASDLITPVKFVHQLQNLYVALIGEELIAQSSEPLSDFNQKLVKAVNHNRKAK